MRTEYQTPKTDDYQIDAFQLDAHTVDYIFAEMRKAAAENKLLFVWNKDRIIFMCPDPENEAEFACKLRDWLNDTCKAR